MKDRRVNVSDREKNGKWNRGMEKKGLTWSSEGMVLQIGRSWIGRCQSPGDRFSRIESMTEWVIWLSWFWVQRKGWRRGGRGWSNFIVQRRCQLTLSPNGVLCQVFPPTQISIKRTFTFHWNCVHRCCCNTMWIIYVRKVNIKEDKLIENEGRKAEREE